MNGRDVWIRSGLGTAQVMCATIAFVLIMRTGVNEVSLGATLVTILLTAVSRMVYGKSK